MNAGSSLPALLPIRSDRRRYLAFAAIALVALLLWHALPHASATFPAPEQDIPYVAFLSHLGLANEARLLTRLDENLFQPLGSSQYLADIGHALIRCAFLLIVATRAALVVTAVAMAWCRFSHRVYRGPDILGRTGNGRLFFSGLRVALDSARSAEGILLISSPIPRVRRRLVRSTEHADCLQEFGAANEANLELLSMILAAKDTPAWLNHDKHSGVNNITLREFSHVALRASLRIHSEALNARVSIGRYATSHGPLEQNLTLDLRAALSDDELEHLAGTRPSLVATTALAVFAGKALNYTHDRGSWHPTTRVFTAGQGHELRMRELSPALGFFSVVEPFTEELRLLYPNRTSQKKELNDDPLYLIRRQ